MSPADRIREELDIKVTAAGIRVVIKAVPRARESRIEGMHGGGLKIRLKAPPADGKANKELIELLAKELDLPRERVTMTAGQSSRTKTLELGMSREEFLTKIQVYFENESRSS